MLVLSLLILLLANKPLAEEVSEETDSTPTALRQLVLPMIDPARGRRLFVTKGCFLCHAVDGIGGMAAPALDAPADTTQLDVMGFVARMWAGAQAMLELQTLELGYQIQLTGDEIADLAAFASSAEAQRGFSMEEIPEALQAWMIDEPYWMGDDWPDNFEREFDKNGTPFDYR